jgi:hypothetical protein
MRIPQVVASTFTAARRAPPPHCKEVTTTKILCCQILGPTSVTPSREKHLLVSTETLKDFLKLERQTSKVEPLSVSSVLHDRVRPLVYICLVSAYTRYTVVPIFSNDHAVFVLVFLVLQYTERMAAAWRVAFSRKRPKTC